MVRLGLLSTLLILTPAPSSGLWTTGNGDVIEAPCPISLEDKARLPQGCQAPRAGVLITRTEYVNSQGELASLSAEVEALQAQIETEREARRVAEADLKSALEEYELGVRILRSTCTPMECPQIKPAAIGGAFALTLCGAVYATHQIMK